MARYSRKTMELIDTHTHPHMDDYGMNTEEFFIQSREAGVNSVICIGTDADDSQRAIEFARKHGVWASVGLHPHEASGYWEQFPRLQGLLPDEHVVAVGECGLDYHYENSPRDEQLEALHAQLNLAKRQRLPVVFHLREAFDDFFEVLDMHQNVSGVVHSFTADESTMVQCMDRGLYIGINGIVTFAKDVGLQRAVQRMPLQSMLLETDAPFLTPHPYRGTVNHSAHVRTVAEYISKIRGESLEEVARITTENARTLFRL